MNRSTEQSHHACALVLGNAGVILRGASGTGKSILARNLIASWQAKGYFARWVADDQIHLMATHGRIIARVPPSIAGHMEMRHFGIQEVAYHQHAVIDLIVDIVDRDQIERIPEKALASLLVQIPVICVPKDDQIHAVELIEAHLDID